MSPMHSCLDILFIGHFAVDRNVVDGVAEIASGGAVYYGGMAAARLGARVGVVTRLSRADLWRLDELRAAGIAVFAVPAAETSGIENTYRSADMERRVCVPLGFAGPFAPADLPDAAAHIYAAVPIMAGEIDLALLKRLAARARETPCSSVGVARACPPGVALDVQGFVRVRVGKELLFRPWDEMAEGLAHVTYFKVDRAEAEALTGESGLAPGSPALARAAAQLAAYGPREIVLTQSAGVTVYADGRLYFAPFTPRSLAGRTGRGDTCFATYLTKRLTSSPEEACRWAAAVTTLKQETPGPWRGAVAEVERALANS